MPQVRVNFWSGTHENIPKEPQSGRILFEEDTGNVFLDVLSRKDGSLFRVQLTDTDKLSKLLGGELKGPLMLSRDPEMPNEAVTKNYVDSGIQEVSDELDRHESDQVVHVSDSDRERWDDKVDKEDGKGLSSNDFTDLSKRKLDGISDGANRVEFSSDVPEDELGSAIKIGTVTIDDETYGVYMPAVSDVAGNAGSATKLENPVDIDGFSFDGTAAISRYAVAEVSAEDSLVKVELDNMDYVDGAVALIRLTDSLPPEGSPYKLEVAKGDGDTLTYPLRFAGEPVEPVAGDLGEYPAGLYVIVADATHDTFVIAAKPSNLDVADTSARGLMSPEDKAKLDSIEGGANAYDLPLATQSSLGGVIVGDNISVSEGRISITEADITAALGYIPSSGDNLTDSIPVFEGADPGLVPRNPDIEESDYVRYEISAHGEITDQYGGLAGIVVPYEILKDYMPSRKFIIDPDGEQVAVGDSVNWADDGAKTGEVLEVSPDGQVLRFTMSSTEHFVKPEIGEYYNNPAFTGSPIGIIDGRFLRDYMDVQYTVDYSQRPPRVLYLDAYYGNLDMRSGSNDVRVVSSGGNPMLYVDPDSPIGDYWFSGFVTVEDGEPVAFDGEPLGRIYPYGNIYWMSMAPVGTFDPETGNIAMYPEASDDEGEDETSPEVIGVLGASGLVYAYVDEPAEDEGDSEGSESVDDTDIGNSFDPNLDGVAKMFRFYDSPETTYVIYEDGEIHTISEGDNIHDDPYGITSPDGRENGMFHAPATGRAAFISWGDEPSDDGAVMYLGNDGVWHEAEDPTSPIPFDAIQDMIDGAVAAIGGSASSEEG